MGCASSKSEVHEIPVVPPLKAPAPGMPRRPSLKSPSTTPNGTPRSRVSFMLATAEGNKARGSQGGDEDETGDEPTRAAPPPPAAAPPDLQRSQSDPRGVSARWWAATTAHSNNARRSVPDSLVRSKTTLRAPRKGRRDSAAIIATTRPLEPSGVDLSAVKLALCAEGGRARSADARGGTDARGGADAKGADGRTEWMRFEPAPGQGGLSAADRDAARALLRSALECTLALSG